MSWQRMRRVGLTGSTVPSRASTSATRLSGSAGAVAGRGLAGASSNGLGNSTPSNSLSPTGGGFDSSYVGETFVGSGGKRFPIY